MTKYQLPLVSRHRVLTVSSLIFVAVILVSFFSRNSDSNVLGYDEAIYVMSSIGHYETTKSFEKNNSILNAIETGVTRTSEAPGIFLLLNLWGKISMEETWLRLLPFIFLVTSLFSVSYIAQKLRLSGYLCILFSMVPLLSSMVIHHSLELRSYGMEVCFNFLAFIFSYRLINDLGKGPVIVHWLVLSLVMIVGLSSRWSFVISYAGIMLCVLYEILMQRKVIGRNLTYFGLFNIIIFSYFLFIFLLTFGHEYGIRLDLLTSDPIKIDRGEYIVGYDDIGLRAAHIFGQIDSIIAIPFTSILNIYQSNLLIVICYIALLTLTNGLLVASKLIRSHRHLLTLIFIIAFMGNILTEESVAGTLFFFLISLSVYPLILLILDKQAKTSRAISSIVAILKPSNPFERMLCIVPVTVIVLSVIFAMLNLYPFEIVSRVSLYLVAHIFMIIVYVVGKSLRFLDQSNSRAYPYVLGSFALLLGLNGLALGNYENIYRGGGAQDVVRSISGVIDLEEIDAVKGWYLTGGVANSFKYSYHFGYLSDYAESKHTIEIEDSKKTIDENLIAFRDKIRSNEKFVILTGHVRKPGEYGVKILNQFESFHVIVGKPVEASVRGEKSEDVVQAYVVSKTGP